MPPVDREVLRQQIHADLELLKAMEGQAVRWNRARRSERVFWTGVFLDAADLALSTTLTGRIALRLIHRLAERQKRIDTLK